MSKNNKGFYSIIQVYCSKCSSLIYKYKKIGKGSLVKCYVSRIISDEAKGQLVCPKCSNEFARQILIRGKPANKLIKGKFFVKGHLKK